MTEARHPFTDSIFGGFADRVIAVIDELSAYNEERNKALQAAKEGAWTSSKLLKRAREIARPEPGSDDKPNAKVLSKLEAYEKLQEQLNAARSDLTSTTAQALKVEEVKEAPEPDATVIADLKAKREAAVAIQRQLNAMTEHMPEDDPHAVTVREWLNDNPIPAIGRDSVLNVTSGGGNAPKYRVDVKAEKDGRVLFEGVRGFVKAANEAAKLKLHAKDDMLTAPQLREVWESVGNSPDKQGKDTAQFEKDGVTYTLTRRVK